MKRTAMANVVFFTSLARPEFVHPRAVAHIFESLIPDGREAFFEDIALVEGL